MKRLITLLLLTAAGVTFSFSQQQREPDSRNHAAAPCPDTVTWTGKYVNYSYGFSVVIPAGFKGLWNSAMCVAGPDGCTCMSDHGRMIPLSTEPYEPDRHIEVYAGYAADLDEPTVKAEADKRLRWISKRSREGSVSVLNESAATLAGLKARRVAVRYYDKELNQWMVEDFVEALRKRDVEYSVYLRTSEKAYEHDRRTFEGVLASFTLRKRE
jgi:hypothetical protein